MSKLYDYTLCPDDNELALFVEGKLTEEKLEQVKRHLNYCLICNETVRMAMEMNVLGTEENEMDEEMDIVTDFAAQADRKLCVLYAEQYILQQLGYSVSMDELLTIAKQNRWIKHQGVQFKNIGKLLEFHSIPIEHKTHATLVDLQNALAQGHQIIVGVDAGELFASSRIKKIAEIIEDWFEQHADHVLIVKCVHLASTGEGEVEVININSEGVKTYEIPILRFLDAWEDSERYMVVVTKI